MSSQTYFIVVCPNCNMHHEGIEDWQIDGTPCTCGNVGLERVEVKPV